MIDIAHKPHYSRKYTHVSDLAVAKPRYDENNNHLSSKLQKAMVRDRITKLAEIERQN